jgi:hypothetical protein
MQRWAVHGAAEKKCPPGCAAKRGGEGRYTAVKGVHHEDYPGQSEGEAPPGGEPVPGG